MMRKMFFKLAVSVAVIAMICPAARPASAETSDVYEKLKASFGETETGEPAYPDYCGGCYYDEDDGDVICVVAANDEERENASKKIAEAVNTSDFKVKEVTYSYRELEEMIELLNQQRQNTRDSELAKNWHGHYLSVSDNAVIVQMSDVSEEQLALFKREVTDSPMLRFEEGGPMVNLGAELTTAQDAENPAADTAGSEPVSTKKLLLAVLPISLLAIGICAFCLGRSHRSRPLPDGRIEKSSGK